MGVNVPLPHCCWGVVFVVFGIVTYLHRMSTAARRHTISNTTQPMDAAMAMVEEEGGMEGVLSDGGGVVVSDGAVAMVSGGGGGGGDLVVSGGGGVVMMVSGGLSP